MKKILTIPLLFLTICALAQPSGYTPGTQVCWTFNGRAHGYFKAAGSGERHILISFTGDGETSCSNYDSQAPQKWLNDSTYNWDGRTVRAPGDTVVWEILTIPNTSSYWLGAYASDIDYFFAHIDAVDTSDHSKFHIEGLSGGVGRMWGYMVNDQSHNSPYRNIFGTTISQSGVWVSSIEGAVSTYSAGRRHWVWYGTADANAGTPPAASIALYDTLQGTKHLTAQSGTGHGAATWDSCMSLQGSDTTTNRWLWMVATDTVPSTPPLSCDSLTGGPAGYTEGTQVCWTFNGRPHGYFRAAGCGERHVLVIFTSDSSTNCTNYDQYAPVKWFTDSGYNWNGITVKPGGDSVKWEVLTIAFTSSYWLPDYARDIDSFFAKIDPIDTSDHSKFHIAGTGGGVGRMWGYLVNDLSHNSPYRSVFGTTISLAGPWVTSSVLSAAKVYSAGRRHWVWHGTSDAVNSYSASQQLYDSLSGTKSLTLQVGGGHDGSTYDTCWALGGSDTSSSRWLWMLADDGGSRMITSAGTPLATPPVVSPVKVLAYPNPAYDKVYIPLGNLPGTQYKLTVTDITGRVYKVIPNVTGASYTLDISKLAGGVYLLRVENPAYKGFIRLIKN